MFKRLIALYFLQQSKDELIEMAHSYYDEVALPKLVLFCVKHELESKGTLLLL